MPSDGVLIAHSQNFISITCNRVSIKRITACTCSLRLGCMASRHERATGAALTRVRYAVSAVPAAARPSKRPKGISGPPCSPLRDVRALLEADAVSNASKLRCPRVSTSVSDARACCSARCCLPVLLCLRGRAASRWLIGAEHGDLCSGERVTGARPRAGLSAPTAQHAAGAVADARCIVARVCMSKLRMGLFLQHRRSG